MKTFLSIFFAARTHRVLPTCVAALIGFAVPAQSADMPLKAPAMAAPLWNGFYAGGHVGYGWGQQPFSVTGDGGFNATAYGGPGGLIAANDHDTVQPKGLIGGLQMGYNYQTGAWLWGLEVDTTLASLHAAPIKTAVDTGAGGTTLTYNYDSKIEWIATIRPRVGWVATPNALIYATGGPAFAQMTSTFALVRAASSYSSTGSASTTRIGWTVGGGLEYLLMRNWTIRGEYRYTDLGTIDYRTLGNPAFSNFFETVSMKTTIQEATLGLNYRF